jgi:hypothetical protein
LRYKNKEIGVNPCNLWFYAGQDRGVYGFGFAGWRVPKNETKKYIDEVEYS